MKSITPKFTISNGSSRFRANAEISRKTVLANIVGKGTTGKSYKYNFRGIEKEWNVKSVGNFDYIFVHYYQDLPK